MKGIIHIEHVLSDQPLYSFRTNLTHQQWWTMLKEWTFEEGEDLITFDNGKFTCSKEMFINLFFVYESQEDL